MFKYTVTELFFVQDSVFWTDWGTESIHEASKFGGSSVDTVVQGLQTPMDIHVMHQLRQPPATRVCDNNGGCPEPKICLPSASVSGKSTYFCACPDEEDGCVETSPEDSQNGGSSGHSSKQGTVAAIVVLSLIGFAAIVTVVSPSATAVHVR